MRSEHKKYILDNMGKKSTAQIASELGMRERNVKKFIRLEGHAGKPPVTAAVTEPKIAVKAVPVKKMMILASIALIIILGFAAYANSLNGKFVYDDEALIKNNALIKDLSLLPKVFTEDIGKGGDKRYGFYRPLQIITYAIDYRLWKLNIAGYHLTNMLLHIMVALCVYWFISMLFGNRVISLITAVFFVVHPIHTEAVSYISGRADSLAALFMLLCFIIYVKQIDRDKINIPGYALFLLTYTCSLLSKEYSLILPLLLLFYHFVFRKKVKLAAFLSLAAISAVYIFVRLVYIKPKSQSSLGPDTIFDRVPGLFVAILSYIKLLFLPFPLHMEYGAKLFRLTDPMAIMGIVTTLALLALAYLKRKNKVILFSIGWFFIALLPVSNLYKINYYMTEHFLYLPSLGFFLLLGAVLSALYKKEKYRIPALIFTLSLLVFYSYLTVRQNETWKDPLRFYERTLKYAPDSSKIRYNLGIVYYKIGKVGEAISMYKKTTELNPDDVEAYNNLANIYDETGRKEDAAAMYKKALELNPNDANIYYNLGIAYYGMGKKEEAIAMYNKALGINPNHAAVYNELGIAYFELGMRQDADAAFKKALEIDPNQADARRNLDAITAEPK